MLGDASAVQLPDACADVVVIFGILHHIVRWREALAECRRLLRAGGVLLVEEPNATTLRGWDRLFRSGHPQTGFSLSGLESELGCGTLRLERRWNLLGFLGFYRARLLGEKGALAPQSQLK